MAIKKHPKQQRQPEFVGAYWPRFKKRAILATVIMQLSLVLAVFFALVINLSPEVISPLFIVILAGIATATVLGNLLFITQLLMPFEQLLAALTKVSGESTDITPPNPSAQHYEHNGFKPVLQLVYSLAAAQHNELDNPPEQEHNDENAIKNALSHTPNGIVFMDTKRQIFFSNTAAPIVEGSDGHKYLELMFNKGDTLNQWLDKATDTIHATHTWKRIPTKVLGENGRRIFDISASYEKGSEAEVVIVLFDKTNSYAPEDDDLDFISFAAHELRGPITVIRGYLDVLNDELSDKIDADTTELISRINVSASRLSGYVNNILNASKYDRRHLKVHLNEDSLLDIYDTIKDDMKLRASSQQRLLSVDIPSDLPTVAADRTAISEVISNFIDNAIKYSSEGGAVEVVASRESEDYVSFAVKDHGIGIPSSLMGNLFQKFYRSHRSRESVSGTGIGLYICKAMVESHGGTVSVTSIEGKGSTFAFTLPTYASVAEKLKNSDNSNESLIVTRGGWIRNHSMYKG